MDFGLRTYILCTSTKTSSRIPRRGNIRTTSIATESSRRCKQEWSSPSRAIDSDTEGHAQERIPSSTMPRNPEGTRIECPQYITKAIDVK